MVSSYDFMHPARVNRDQLRALEGLHDNFARLLSSTFSGAMREVVEVDTAFVDQTTYAEFIRSLSNPSCSYQFVMRPARGQAIVDIAMPVVFACVDRTFGGKGESAGVANRQLTPIEIGVINRITKRVIGDLEAAWEPLLPIEICDIELETNPEFLSISPPEEIVILLAFEVKMQHASGLVSLGYPFFTLELFLPRLGAVRTRPNLQPQPHEEELLRRDNRLRLGSMQLEATAELGRTRIPLSEARTLRVGDVVRLPTGQEDPVVVHVEGRPKFLARPFAGRSGGIRLKVVGPVPPDYATG
jgi:flagellar motor switch protein FliM